MSDLSSKYHDLLLGKDTTYSSEYDPDLLCPIDRQIGRDALAIPKGQLPFTGVDHWTAYELSWLNSRGKPVVATADFCFDCRSPAIIESKSFKLYLNSFNQTRFADLVSVQAALENDLSQVSGASVAVTLYPADHWSEIALAIDEGQCLDELDVEIQHYHTEPQLLRSLDSRVAEQSVCSHLLRSLCPVTGQPDWGSVYIRYSGREICPKSLLKYIVSYRQHQEFHEQCVERIFKDVMAFCQPDSLTVYARYLRRGGLDINPYRSTDVKFPDNLPTYRQ
jgi:7-cyano-7-deazaguanine reductase